jgi:hypothetical protein
MRIYLFFNNKKLPSAVRAMEFIYDKSFRTRLYSGGRYSKRDNELPFYIQFRWPKWEDNEETPDHSRLTSIDLLFSPFHKDVRASRNIMKISKKLNYKYVALCETYVCDTTSNMLSKIDLNTFIKTAYFYLRETKGQMFYKNKLYSADKFYKAFRNNIEAKFTIKLTKKDFRIINVPEHFKKLDKV